MLTTADSLDAALEEAMDMANEAKDHLAEYIQGVEDFRDATNQDDREAARETRDGALGAVGELLTQLESQARACIETWNRLR